MSDDQFVPPSLEETSDGTHEVSTENLWDVMGRPAVMAVIAGPADGRSVRLLDLPIVVGRSRDLADFAIDDAGMSKRHFQIFSDRDTLVIQDLQSSNGTLLNGAAVDRAPLKHGDTVGAGSSLMQFVALRPPPDQPKPSTSAPSAPPRKRSKTDPGMSTDED